MLVTPESDRPRYFEAALIFPLGFYSPQIPLLPDSFIKGLKRPYSKKSWESMIN